jgi:hypothetical protein
LEKINSRKKRNQKSFFVFFKPARYIVIYLAGSIQQEGGVKIERLSIP